MHRALRAIAGGIAGTALMSLLFLLLQAQTRSQIPMFDVIARFAGFPDEPALGFAIFILVGAIAWPLLFVAVLQYIPGGPDPAARGVVFAGVLWVFFVVTGRGNIGGALLVIYIGFTLLAHMAYGFTLGAVYQRLEGPPAESDVGQTA